MRYSKIVTITLPVLLVGCLDVFDNDSGDSFYTPPPPPVAEPPPLMEPAPVVEPAPMATSTPVTVPRYRRHAISRPRVSSPPPRPSSGYGASSCGCPEKEATTPMALPAVPTVPAVVSPIDSADWYPSEGDLVRAGDLVMEQKRMNGGIDPSHAAMAAHIQSRLGLTASQAEKVLEEMGL